MCVLNTSTFMHAHIHTHILEQEEKKRKNKPLIASVKNLHAGHLCESLLVEMKGAGASKPCVLSVPKHGNQYQMGPKSLQFKLSH